MADRSDKRTRPSVSADLETDHGQAQADQTTITNLQDGQNDLDNMYKLRNGRGQVLQTPKRSSITRAKELLTTPPTKVTPGRLTVTGADWQMASVVRACWYIGCTLP